MDELDISVLVAVHNRAESLPTFLAHLELQSYPAARFEVLLVDENSDDRTADVLLRYAAGAPIPLHYLRQDHPGTAQARNLGIREARGKYLLFLDPDLLAGPALVERHVQAHEAARGAACVIGDIELHPQMAKPSLVSWHLLERNPHLEDNQALHFLDWRGLNMSLPRKLLLEAGGFDEEFLFPYFDDAELAWRLSRKGIHGIFVPEATAYIWRPSSIEAERKRYYAKGYSLFSLVRKTKAPEALRRYNVRRNPLVQRLDDFIVGPSARACEQVDQQTRLFKSLYRRVLRYELCRGYSDARKGRPPREYALGR